MGDWLSWLERCAHIAEITGSNPVSPIMKMNMALRSWGISMISNSFYYPFGFIWPANFTVHFGLAFLVLPIYLSIEILLRKVIYPLLSFSKSEASKTKMIIITAVILIISLSTLTSHLSGFPSGVLTTFVFLIVIILNTKIFENLKSFYPVVLISFLIIQIFLATLLSNVIGVINSPCLNSGI